MQTHQTETTTATKGAAVRVLALAVMIATFLLIITGGNVTTMGSELPEGVWLTRAVAFDPEKWTGIPLVRDDRAHVVVGVTVWLLVTLLAVAVFRSRSAGAVRVLVVVAWVGVGLQAGLGWLRVSEMSQPLAIVHACVAHAFFCLTVALVNLTGSRAARPSATLDAAAQTGLRRITGLVVLVLYVSAVLGAVLRHTQAVSAMVLHTGGAVAVSGVLCLLAHRVLTKGLGETELGRPLFALFGVFGAGVALGITSLLAVAAMETSVPQTRTQAYIPTVHVALGAIMLGIAVHMSLRVRTLTPAASSADAAVTAPEAGSERG